MSNYNLEDLVMAITRQTREIDRLNDQLYQLNQTLSKMQAQTTTCANAPSDEVRKMLAILKD